LASAVLTTLLTVRAASRPASAFHAQACFSPFRAERAVALTRDGTGTLEDSARARHGADT
jgi:hypothetical protein